MSRYFRPILNIKGRGAPGTAHPLLAMLTPPCYGGTISQDLGYSVTLSRLKSLWGWNAKASPDSQLPRLPALQAQTVRGRLRSVTETWTTPRDGKGCVASTSPSLNLVTCAKTWVGDAAVTRTPTQGTEAWAGCPGLTAELVATRSRTAFMRTSPSWLHTASQEPLRQIPHGLTYGRLLIGKPEVFRDNFTKNELVRLFGNNGPFQNLLNKEFRKIVF